MVLMAGADLPLTAIRQQVSSAIDLIVQQARMQDGSRRIVQITEVVGMESGTITTQDLFVYQQTGLDENGRVQGSFQPQGIRPHFYDKIVRYGIDLPLSIFGW
jgi:pilus assembly protein CpaF